MANARNAFIEATFRASRSYQLWGELRLAFRQYVDEEIEKAMRSPSSEAISSHGYARALMDLRDTIEGIDNIHKKLHP